MRHPTAPVLLGLVLAAAAACADSASRLAAPDISTSSLGPSTGPSLSQANSNNGNNGNNGNDDQDNNNRDGDERKEWDKRGDNDKITICHAAGRAGTTKYVEITVSKNASSAHLDEHGTPRAGHEQDYIEPEGEHGCKRSGATITKTLYKVMSWGANGTSMMDDPTWKAPDGVITVPQNDTRWIDFMITYTLPAGVTGTISENQTAVCATAGPGVNCSAGFSTSDPWRPLGNNVYGVAVSGSGSVIAQYDIYNPGLCNETRSFINTVTFTPAGGGAPISVSAPVRIKYTCESAGTITKALYKVMKWGPNGSMIEEVIPPGGDITVPLNDTRWIDWIITYTLPNGTTATVVENQTAVCATAGAGVNCSAGFSTSDPWRPLSDGVFGVTVSAPGSVIAQYDIYNPGLCNVRRQLTNSATLKRAGTTDVTVSSPVWIKFTC
jgi:hypothetical protein